jgi:ribose-phosphate pyrophosphokinase
MTFADPAMFAGRPIVLVDDIVSSGGTILACTKALVAAGATTIDAVITHALFPPEMTARFLDAGLRSIRSTHSVPHPTNAIELDALLAEALRKEFIVAGSRGLAS